MVRAEFCKKVEEAGGLDLIKTAMETYGTSDVWLIKYQALNKLNNTIF